MRREAQDNGVILRAHLQKGKCLGTLMSKMQTCKLHQNVSMLKLRLIKLMWWKCRNSILFRVKIRVKITINTCKTCSILSTGGSMRTNPSHWTNLVILQYTNNRKHKSQSAHLRSLIKNLILTKINKILQLISINRKLKVNLRDMEGISLFCKHKLKIIQRWIIGQNLRN